MTFNVALLGPQNHGKSMLVRCLVAARTAAPHHGRADRARFHASRLVGTRDASARFLSALLGIADDVRLKFESVMPMGFSFGSGARHYVGIDIPGAARYLRRNYCAVLSSVDAVIVVVSPLELGVADEALLVEQLSVARHLGVECGVVLSNKSDLVALDADRDALREMTDAVMRRVLSSAGHTTPLPIVVGAAGPGAIGDPAWCTALDLERVLDRLPDPVRDETGPLRLPALFDYRIAGRGSVAAGVLARGRLSVGDAVTVLGAPRGKAHERRHPVVEFESSVHSLRIFDTPHETLGAGSALGALVSGQRTDGRSVMQPHPIVPESGFTVWKPTELVTWGMTVVTPGSAHTTRRFRARWSFPAHLNARALSARTSFLFHAGCGYERGTLAIDAMIQPGDCLTADALLDLPLFVEPGMRVTARVGGVVGFGEVVEIDASIPAPRA